MKFVLRLWNRLRRPGKTTAPVTDKDQARERLLREILTHAELALTYSEPCSECKRRAALIRDWKKELDAELKSIRAIG